MGCIILELKHKINPFKKNFFFERVKFWLPKLESFNFKVFLEHKKKKSPPKWRLFNDAM
nr:MAG TPA: hypothetical protein [Caudoviricetes sp.]